MALLLASGCDPIEVTVDGGPALDAGPAGFLTLESEPSLALTVNGVAPIAIRYTEEERPVAGTPVRFALEGTAHDSAVADLERQTDGEGRAETTITAGTVSAVFRVRVSADRAAPAYVNVSVGTEGFGTLTVAAPYAGGREGAARRTIRIYAETECDPPGGYPTFADRAATLEAPEEVGPRWTLPVGLRYAAVVTVEGASGVTLAAGCRDDIELLPEAETVAEVALTDSSLAPEGRYDVVLELEARAPVGAAVRRGLEAGTAVVPDEAALYLMALEAELRERELSLAADALLAERLDGDLDASLGNALAAGAVGPLVGLGRLGARLEARLARMRVSGPLTLTRAGAVLGGTWAADRLEVGASRDPDGPPPSPLALETLGVPLAPTLTLSWDPRVDAAQLERLALTLRLGAVLGGVLDLWLAEEERPGALLRDGAGCEVLRDWIAIDPALGPACDGACAEAACLRALDGVVEATRAALVTTGGSPDAIALSGTVSWLDEDGDLSVDQVSAPMLSGVWSGGPAGDDEAILADLAGGRVAP